MAVVVWSPYLQKDIDKLEAVQKSCLKLSNNKFTLPTLNDRRFEADIKGTFKFLDNKYITKPQKHIFYRSKPTTLNKY